MSLKAQAICPVPQETVRVARAAYPNGNVYLHMRDVLGSIYTDEDFADLFPKDGQPAQARFPLSSGYRAPIYGEPNFPACRRCGTWTARLEGPGFGLELTDPGFDASVLSEFRTRLIEKHAEELLLEKMLTLFGQKGWREQPVADNAPQDPCVGEDPRPQPGALCLGNHAGCSG